MLVYELEFRSLQALVARRQSLQLQSELLAISQ